MRELLDVVHQAVELPLRIDFRFASERKAVEPLVVSDVAEHWLHGGKALPVAPAACFAVDLAFHPLGVGFRVVVLAGEEHHLAHRGAVGVAQAPGS